MPHSTRAAGVVAGLLAIAGATASPPGRVAAADLAGRWRAEIVDVVPPPPQIVQVTQVGDTVTIPIVAFGITQLTGTITGPGEFDLTGSPVALPYHGRLLPNEAVIDGLLLGVPPPAPFKPMTLTRCGCFDGNTSNGDGCDASCQVEPCHACSGDPSVCTPTPDGGICDDRRDCTTGETCAAGVCGGSTPVVPCVDMTGSWQVRLESPPFGIVEESTVNLVQRNGVVRSPDGSWRYLGTIDPPTGGLDLAHPAVTFVSGPLIPLFVSLTGSAGSDVFTGDTAWQVGRSFHPATATGTRTGTPPLCPDDCGPCRTCQPPAGCVAAPRPSCRTSTAPEKTALKLQNRTPDTKDKLDWKWMRGLATTLADFGNPVTDDDYTLCIFDESSATPAFLADALAPADGTCAGKQCWQAKGVKGFAYKDKEATPDGLTGIALTAGETGKAKAVVKGKGDLLTLPPLPLPVPLRVQLQGENGACFEAYYDAAGVLVNDAATGKFKARASAFP